jgi:outer membrane protein assembly factor BamB
VTNFRPALYGWLLPGALIAGAAQADAQWNQFRGPNGSGVDASSGYPVAFSPSSNVKWKAGVPFGQSSPIVMDRHVYLTGSEGDRLLTIALDEETGRELWRRELPRERPNKIYRANDPASPTAAADGDGVVVFFADFGLAAYTPDGKERWRLPLGPFKSFYGMAASPILAGDLVILVCDQQSGSFLLAADRATGRVRWKTDRPGAVDGYATPMVFRPANGGPPQLIVLGSTRLNAYALDTGTQQWSLPIGSSGAMGTAVASGDTLFVSTLGSSEPPVPAFDAVLPKYDTDKDGRLSVAEFSVNKDFAEHFGFFDLNADNFINAEEWSTLRNYGVGEYGAIAFRPQDAKGQIDPQAVLWRFKKNIPYIPAPLVYKNVLYLVKDGGIITALDATSGRVLKEGRSPDALGEYHASPVAADDKLFLANVEGKITVLKAGAEWEVLGVNDIGEEIHATPALSAGRIYVRTKGTLYCFSAK